MSFLAPLFLLGALAVAGPVIFHLVRRTTRDRTPFSSLLFLEPDPPRLTERSRVEHWLLLLLRAAALALLALAFARPFFRAEASPRDADGSAKRSVLLVDVSASMRRSGLREAALAKVESVTKNAGPGDSVALLAFAGGTRTLMDFAQWSELPPESRAAQAMAWLKETELTWENTNLAAALGEAADLLRGGPNGAGGAESGEGGEILVISDLQEGSRLAGLQGRDWPRGTTVSLEPLVSDKTGNAGIALAAGSPPPAGGGLPPARLRVWNSQDSESARFQLGWAAAAEDGARFQGPAKDLQVPPGQSRVLSLDWPGLAAATGEDALMKPEAAASRAASPVPPPPGEANAAAAAALPKPGRILLQGDQADFDNTVYAVPPRPVTVRAFYLGEEAAEDTKQPLFFLNRALPQSRLVRVELKALPGGGELPQEELGKPDVYFVSGSPAQDRAETLRRRMEEGSLTVLVLTNPAQAQTLARLAGVAEVKVEEAPADKYAMLAGIDFKHPLFAPFADPRFSDFTKIRFWRHRKVDAAALPGARVLAGFDSGNPALLELQVGKGRLVVLSSGWHPADSQLALSSKFVPLVASLLESGGVIRNPRTQFAVGEPVPRAALGFVADRALSVTLPDGKTETWEASGSVFSGTAQPGIYRVAESGAGTGAGSGPDSGTGFFAVNVDPSESRTAPLPREELERLGVPLAGSPSTVAAALREGTPDPGAVETESRQKLWRWIIAGALTVLIAETLLAGLSARRPALAAPNTGGPDV